MAFVIECYSLLVNGPVNKQLTEKEFDAVFQNATHDYGVEVTPEMFEAINEYKLHELIVGFNLRKFYYFRKSYFEPVAGSEIDLRKGENK